MALTAFEKKRLSVILDSYCDKKVPPHVRDQVYLSYKFRGDSVTLFENRPVFRKPGEWVECKVAQFRRENEGSAWHLYWGDRNGRWHLFEPFPKSRVFEELLGEVDEDRTGIFYG